MQFLVHKLHVSLSGPKKTLKAKKLIIFLAISD